MKEAKRVRGKAMNNPERNVDEQKRDDMGDRIVRQEEPPMEQIHNPEVDPVEQSKNIAPKKLIRDIRTLFRKTQSPESSKVSNSLPKSPHGHLKRMLGQNPNIQATQTTSRTFPYESESCGKEIHAKKTETAKAIILQEPIEPTDTTAPVKGATDSEDDMILTELPPNTN